jgi:hypothetical protein
MRTISGTQSQDNQSVYNTDLIDQYGVKLKANDWTYSVGRQGVWLGQGTIFGFGNDVGAWDSKLDGLVAGGKLGAVDTKFVVGRTDAALNSYTAASRNIWGIDFAAPLSDNVTFGATYATVKMNGADEANKYLGVNATFNPSANLTLNAEYVKSNADTDNKAYFICGTYSWDKDWFCIQYQNVKANSVDIDISVLGANTYPYHGNGLTNAKYAPRSYTGMTYVYNHQMSKAAAFNVCYESLKATGFDGNDDEYAAGVTWAF